MAHRKRLILVCVNRRPDGSPNGSCAARGSVEVHARLKALLKERGLADIEARACSSSCLDACWAGPCIAVEPDHYYYGRVRLEDVNAIVDALARGKRVEHLVLKEQDFASPKVKRSDTCAP